MFNSQLASDAQSPVTIRRGSSLVSIVALIAAGAVVLILALTIGGSGAAPQSRAANPLPQVRDMAPAWNRGAQVGPVSTPIGSSATPPAPVRDPETHALLTFRP